MLCNFTEAFSYVNTVMITEVQHLLWTHFLHLLWLWLLGVGDAEPPGILGPWHGLLTWLSALIVN